MPYLTEEEYYTLGFDEVENFEKLLNRAELAIDLFIRNFYVNTDFETDFEVRKDAVKRATAFQIAYLDATGIMSAEDKTALGSVTIGRTSVSYQGNATYNSLGREYNLSLDTIKWLQYAGFGAGRVFYDR